MEHEARVLEQPRSRDKWHFVYSPERCAAYLVYVDHRGCPTDIVPLKYALYPKQVQTFLETGWPVA